MARPTAGQQPLGADSLPGRPAIIGSPADERARVGQLFGTRGSEGMLLRSPSSARTTAERPLSFIVPDARGIWNDALPVADNDGAMWAGRGTSAIVRGGAVAHVGPVRVILLPEFTISQNRSFAFRPSDVPGRSPFASPWWNERGTIDLPTRFGDRGWWLFTPGQSSVTATVRGTSFGVATENDWWGPGVRNALVLGNAAEGFPHLFVRTARPWRTVIGDVEARLLLGLLTPSLYFDDVPVATFRSFDAVGVTLRPAIATRLTVGVARSVVRSVTNRRDAARHVLDALFSWEPAPSTDADRPEADYYTSLFARWVSPEAHVEMYGEVAYDATPRSFREWVLTPHQAQGVTLGAQVIQPLGDARSHVRIQAEYSSVEQSIALGDRPAPTTFYTGLGTREGYTNRGQMLGASFGPGGSSHWLAADLLRTRGRVGLAVGRVRWNEDALSRQPNANFFRHDVTGFIAVRSLLVARFADVTADLTWSRRNNYEFQNGIANAGGLRTVDVPNVSIAFGVTPR